MTYESFAIRQYVKITDVVQDPTTNAWMYVLHVQCGGDRIEDSSADGFSHEYLINRRFSEFKQLHSEVSPIMGSALTPLPADGLITLIMSDNEELLANRKQVLQQIINDVLNHSAAKDLPEVEQFLGRDSLSAQVLAPLLNPATSHCNGSLRKTSGPSWTASNSSVRSSALVSS